MNVFAERDRLYPLKADLGEGDPYHLTTHARRVGTRISRVTMDEVEAAQPRMILCQRTIRIHGAHVPLFAALDTLRGIERVVLFW
jgi:hypothetical protein